MTHPLEPFIDEIEKIGLNVSRDVPGSTLTTYRVGGPISYCVTLTSRDDINHLAHVISTHYFGQLTDSNVVTIGKGSNILVDDDGFDGCVFLLDGELATTQGAVTHSEGHISITAGGGVSLPVFARQCVPESIAGLEFYVGIPGSVGGAVAMNAGGHGKQTSDVLISCNVLNLSTGVTERFSQQSCHFAYRSSRFGPTDVIYSAQFKGTPGDSVEIKNAIDEIVAWRRDHQPGGRNVGSVFQNPEGIAAAQLIEQCDLKGFRIGGAHISQKHANFIQADESASARDIKELIDHVRTTVAQSTKYELATEVRYIPKA